jgi:hypothetical protein
MERRTFLTAGGAAAALALIGPSPAAAAVREPLFSWEQPGGFFAPGRGVLTPPALVVYPDGTVYADAQASLRLRFGAVEGLRADAVQALSEPIVSPGEGHRPVDVVRVLMPDGDHRTANLAGWPHPAYRPELHRLYARVQELRRLVLRGGEPWRPDAVLVAAVRLDAEPDAFRGWPQGVPLPVGRLYGETRVRGPRARAVWRRLTAATGDDWPRYLAPDGSFVAATWRHLLPHE